MNIRKKTYKVQIWFWGNGSTTAFYDESRLRYLVERRVKKFLKHGLTSAIGERVLPSDINRYTIVEMKRKKQLKDLANHFIKHMILPEEAVSIMEQLMEFLCIQNDAEQADKSRLEEIFERAVRLEQEVIESGSQIDELVKRSKKEIEK